MTTDQLNTNFKPTWCPGCGDFGIWAALKAAITQLNWPLERLVVVYGVGCHGNMSSNLKLYGFHGLHGRALPAAEGIKLANHKLKVVVVSGDGDLLGEGMNHFITACRGNHDLTILLHNNQVYGLTTGQSSPTSLKGTKSKTTPLGVIDEPINAPQLALLMGATHVARGFAGNIPQLTGLVKSAIEHKGLALVDVLQPCVTYNKLNTYDWFRQRLKNLETTYESRFQALSAAVWTDKQILLGEFYKENKELFHEQWPQIKEKTLIQNQDANRDLSEIISKLK